MNKQEKAKYKDARPIGVMCLSNWGGLEVMGIEYGIDDYIIWRFNYGEPQNLHRSVVNYKPERPSFRAGRMTIHLDEVMRV